MPEVVSNTGPLIALASIGRLDLLRALFGVVYFPLSEVLYHEVLTSAGEVEE